MRGVTPDGERLAEMAGFLGQRLNSALKDVVPAEAQVHLLNAQRELLTAVFLIYEHQLSARRPPTPRRPPASRAPTRRQARVTKIRVD